MTKLIQAFKGTGGRLIILVTTLNETSAEGMSISIVRDSR